MGTRLAMRFQHTYEGLKLDRLSLEIFGREGFQHTYEGLKLFGSESCAAGLKYVLSIPMRD